MSFHKHGPRAIAIATLVAFAGIAAYSVPAIATPPTPARTALVWATFSPPAAPAPGLVQPHQLPAPIPAPAATLPAPSGPLGQEPGDLSRSDRSAMITDLAARPAPAKLAAAKPAPAKPATAKPATAKPATAKPATAKPATAKPATPPAPKFAVNASIRARIVGIALAQRGRPYVSGGSGPGAFDCSGLVQYAYRLAGVSNRLGGGHSALGIYLWARSHGLTSSSNPQLGDVVVYGGGSHVAIYIGNGRVVSALNPGQGIQVTGLHALGASFTTFVHTRV